MDLPLVLISDWSDVIKLLCMKNPNIDLYSNLSKTLAQIENRDVGQSKKNHS